MLRSVLLTIGLLGTTTMTAVASVDINGGTSWSGWEHRGNSRAVGLWGAQSTTRNYELYTTVFTFNNNAITGGATQVRGGGTPVGFAAGAYSQGAFSNGNTVLGIGLKFAGGARAMGQTFVSFDLRSDSFQAASALGATDGRVSLSQWGHTGDFSAWMDAATGLGPSNLGVLNANGTAFGGAGTVSNLPGGYGSGVSYDFAFRQFRQGDVNGSMQMFFDLTAMQALYGVGGSLVQNSLPGGGGWSPFAAPIGAFGSNLRIAMYNAEASHADASQVTFGVTVPAPGAVAVLGLFGLAGTRRRR